MSLLSARGVVFGFTGRPVLRGIELDVGEGECVGLLGPNGAGKTTLLRLLAGLLRPSAGSIRMHANGGDTGVGSAAARKRLGYLGHKLLVYPHLTGEENLAFFATLHGVSSPRRAARLMLERVGLADASSRPVRAYSRGMGQRLALARALLPSPALLLMDEPYSGLDGAASELLTRLLKEHLSCGGSLVLASHDLDRVARLCERALVIDGGKVGMELSQQPGSEGGWTEPYRLRLEEVSRSMGKPGGQT